MEGIGLNKDVSLSSNGGSRLLICLLFLLISLPAYARTDRTPTTIAAIDSVLADSTLLHNKVVYVDFWASWCAPCRQSFPWMKALQDKYHDRGFEVVAVNVDKETAAARKFLDVLKSPLRVVPDSTGTLAKMYKLEAMPTSFIYGRDGKLRTDHRGFYPKDTLSLDSLVKSLLEEKPQK